MMVRARRLLRPAGTGAARKRRPSLKSEDNQKEFMPKRAGGPLDATVTTAVARKVPSLDMIGLLSVSVPGA